MSETIVLLTLRKRSRSRIVHLQDKEGLVKNRFSPAYSALVVTVAVGAGLLGMSPEREAPTQRPTRVDLMVVYVVVPGEPTPTPSPTAAPTPKTIPCQNWSVAWLPDH